MITSKPGGRIFGFRTQGIDKSDEPQECQGRKVLLCGIFAGRSILDPGRGHRKNPISFLGQTEALLFNIFRIDVVISPLGRADFPAERKNLPRL
jgi:hypothetical protein